MKAQLQTPTDLKKSYREGHGQYYVKKLERLHEIYTDERKKKF